MEVADYQSAFEDYLRNKETFKCSEKEMDSFLLTLPITKEIRNRLKKTTLENPPTTLKVHGQTVSLSSSYIKGIKAIQNILKKDESQNIKLSCIIQSIRDLMGSTHSKLVWEISTILDISGEEKVSLGYCKKKQRLCDAKVKMHHYLLMEGLQDVIASITEKGPDSVEELWKSCKSISAPLAMSKVGMNHRRFEVTLKSYPEVFQVEGGKVFLNGNPQITYSLILSHMQSGKLKLRDHLYKQGALLKNELFHSAPHLLNRAEMLAMGEGMEMFNFTLQSLSNDFLIILPHMLVVVKGTSQVQDNPFVSAISKIKGFIRIAQGSSQAQDNPLVSAVSRFKDFVRGKNTGDIPTMSQLLVFVNDTLNPREQVAVGSTSQKLRETITAYPDHFAVNNDRVFVKSDDVILPDMNSKVAHNTSVTIEDQAGDRDGCLPDQCSESSEALAHSNALDQEIESLQIDIDVRSSVLSTEDSELSPNSDDSSQDAGTLGTENVCTSTSNSSIHNTEKTGSKENLGSVEDHETNLPHSDNIECSSMQNAEDSRDNPDQDHRSPITDDAVSSTGQLEGSSNSDALDQKTGSPCTDDGVYRLSSVQSVELPEDSADSDLCDQETGSSHNNNEACTCSSVQNMELPGGMQVSETSDGDTDMLCNDDCFHTQNADQREDSVNSASLDKEKHAPETDNDVSNSIQTTVHSSADLRNSDLADHGPASPRGGNNQCSTDQITDHPLNLVNSNGNKDLLCPNNDVGSYVKKTECSDDVPNLDTLDIDTDLTYRYSAHDIARFSQKTKDFEDFSFSNKRSSLQTINDELDGSLDQSMSLGQDEVESLGSDTISDSESLHSGMSNEIGNLEPASASAETEGRDTVTVLQDFNYFGELIKDFLSKSIYPILSVSLFDGWFIVGLWDGPTFAISLTLTSGDHKKVLGPLERSALDFLTSGSILKVVFGKQLLTEVSDTIGIKMINVFDLQEAECLIKNNSKKSQTLLESLKLFGIDPCPVVEVCIGTIQAPSSGEVYGKEAILKLKETARWTMKQVPHLYQKMLRMMLPHQITDVSQLYCREVEGLPSTSSKTKEPSCSTTSSGNSNQNPSASSVSVSVSQDYSLVTSTTSQKHDLVSSAKEKATSEKPVSVHRVSSTSDDLVELEIVGQAQTTNGLVDMEENLHPDILTGPGPDSILPAKDKESRPVSSITTSRRSEKKHIAMPQEKATDEVPKGSVGSTNPQAASEQEMSQQSSSMANDKVIHYNDAGKPTLIPFTSKLANKAINPCQTTHELAEEFDEIVKHDQEKFVEAFGICIKYSLKTLAETDESLSLDQLSEVVLDLGRKPSARYYQPEHPGQLKIRTLTDKQLTKQDLKDFVKKHCSPVSGDRKTSIKDTLHRVGIIYNRRKEPIGLTALTRHAVLGCATPLFDLMNQGQSILIIGNPGVGKSTILREAARVINDVAMRRVVVVDTYNEITGDGDVPHPAIGGARRVQIPGWGSQSNMIKEVVRNHSPLTLVIDEVATEADAAAVLATRQRGIQVIAAVPGQTLQDVILNPNLKHLSGAIQNMVFGHPGQQVVAGHTAMQRTQPAAFDILVEMYDRYRWIVHMDFTRAIDLCLQRVPVGVQERRVFMKEISEDTKGVPQVVVKNLVVTYPL
ncbi:uncharacterized protein LOC121411388 [Lytechinus variegatus]|uniref:uncharacterized protein LOC121411388 n=1 Tax=Lytechinus variegatus TaxID=7654 RepID=UPI001BB2C163|nr:uncharacterized protein LOC121411388 [Lytechinus variegatus]XP_041460020.1 uncharacterized protein LOC121411388 [Lytechinus variegatus]XP_041460021.1 uncharacterized protein LOC121411388 [Lytechinus variegatus]